jgi:hypothetical protein
MSACPFGGQANKERHEMNGELLSTLQIACIKRFSGDNNIFYRFLALPERFRGVTPSAAL